MQGGLFVMPESYEDRLRDFTAAVAAMPVRVEDSERMASILASIRTREEHTQDDQRARVRRAG